MPKTPKAVKSTKKVLPSAAVPIIDDGFQDREVVYPNISVELHQDNSRKGNCTGALTIDDAKQLLGWVEDSAENPLKKEFLLKDVHGTKIRCVHNDKNRPFTLSNALAIQQEIIRRKWRLNGETLIIGRTGLTLSCQHRLVGFILAVQEYNKHPDKYSEFWSHEPTMECIIVYGINEDDETVNTIDTGKPRTLSDVIYRSEYFADLSQGERKVAAKTAQYAINMLWDHTGVSEAHSIYKTHAESLEFVSRHPRLLECVAFVLDMDSEGKLRHYLTPGYAAALLYLMGSSLSPTKEYYTTPPHNETQLNWDRWDLACDFLLGIAVGSAKVSNVAVIRKAFANLGGVDGNVPTNGERIALLCKAWGLLVADKPYSETNLKLKYHVEEDGFRRLIDSSTAGGIDIGSGKEMEDVLHSL